MIKHTSLHPVSEPEKHHFTPTAAYSLPASPPTDNMGVNNATQSGPNPVEGQALTVEVNPDHYFYRLALDTLQVSVYGYWSRKEETEHLLNLREQAEIKQKTGLGDVRFFAHDGSELLVFPHDGRPSYRILMRDAEGLEVRAMPRGNMPSFLFRFGARWCVEQSLDALSRWVRAFVGALGFSLEQIRLSEAHIRCDVPTAFVERDLKRMRGTGARNGRFNSHHYQGRLSGIDNLGGKKPFKFCIYDKRLEQQQKDGLLWPSVWADYGIPPDSLIWRIEARWNREALKLFGLDLLGDLGPRTMRGLWHWFTHQYLHFVSDVKKRAGRAGVTRKWKKVQACGEFMEPSPIQTQPDLTETKLFKQAAGCIAKALAVSGLGHLQAEVEQLLDDVCAVSEERFTKGRLTYTVEAIDSILDSDRNCFAGAEQSRAEIYSALRESLSRRVIAKPIGSPQTT